MATSKTMARIGWAVTVLSVLPFIPSALMKFRNTPEVQQGMAHLGFPEALLMTLALLEIGSVVIYLVPKTAMLGAILLTGYLGGTICTHLRVGEPVYLQTTIGVCVWLGLWLRDARLRALIPLRTCPVQQGS